MLCLLEILDRKDHSYQILPGNIHVAQTENNQFGECILLKFVYEDVSSQF